MTLICLQGGAEFGTRCRDMDADLVQRASAIGDGRVVIAALAGAVGREYERAGANGVRHFTALGASAVSAPDARSHPDAAREAWRAASLLVLPGGSPSRLLEGLRATGFDALLAELLADGVVVMGASAGAMVLCQQTWLPDRGSVVDGLGLVPGHAVLPHWDGRRQPPKGFDDVRTLGIPEQSGVLVADGVVIGSVGDAVTTVMRGTAAKPVPRLGSAS